MKLIILGAPGSGKGTQAKLIAKRRELAHVSTGDILRSAIKAGTMMGVVAQEYMYPGKLVPDDIIIKLILDRVNDDDCRKGYILDGFPRTLIQAEQFHNTHVIDMVINLTIEPEILGKRISGRRSCASCGAVYHVELNPPKTKSICDKCSAPLIHRRDDTEETLHQRLEVYFEETEPLIKFYTDVGKLVDIKGEGDIESIHERIEDKLSQLI
jgi:adenylate kinase